MDAIFWEHSVCKVGTISETDVVVVSVISIGSEGEGGKVTGCFGAVYTERINRLDDLELGTRGVLGGCDEKEEEEDEEEEE